MPASLLYNALVIIVLSGAVLYLCHLARIPVIVGFLLTGIISGPQGLGVITDVASVRELAEVGIIILLFTIGIEFSFQNLRQLRRPALMGGSLQIGFTALAAALIAAQAGLPAGEAVLIGFIVSLSSTAIVMRILQERAEIDTPHGGAVLGILVFQDLMVVPMMLLLPVLAGFGGLGAGLPLSKVIELGGVLLLLFVSWKTVPWILYQVTRTRSRELFLLTLIVIGLSIALLTYRAGLSLALGAFLAGLIISESEYSHQALSNLLPFRDVFMSIFFISVGMLLDVKFFFLSPVAVILLALAAIGIKALFAGAASGFTGLPLRTMIIAGLCLGQVGEFSFILSESALRAGLLPQGHYQIILAASILTMLATPFIIRWAPRLAELAARLRFLRGLDIGVLQGTRKQRYSESDHLVIVGFGINGRNIAKAARKGGIPYVIIEMNPVVIREETAKGEPIFYGDATQENILEHANIGEARCLVIVINDPAAAARITWVARRVNPGIYIIVRTRFLREIERLAGLGANEVIPEEFETSVEIFSRVMRNYMLPRDEIEELISEIRADQYDMLRTLSQEAGTCTDFRACLPELKLASLRMPADSPLTDKTLAQTEMRKKFGVTLLALVRDRETFFNPAPDIVFRTGDVLFLAGLQQNIRNIERLFRQDIRASDRTRSRSEDRAEY
jgi:CPA2 family monovalent cation:H+ antiporter-2